MSLIERWSDVKKLPEKMVFSYVFSRMLFGIGLGVFLTYLLELNLLWSVAFFSFAIIFSIPAGKALSQLNKKKRK